jgi:hypothetical protein
MSILQRLYDSEINFEVAVRCRASTCGWAMP